MPQAAKVAVARIAAAACAARRREVVLFMRISTPGIEPSLR
jgi:hypothetical protein